jgi:non-specific protein-tyrosine kinase
MIAAKQVGDTNLLEISVEHTDPAFAQALAAMTAQIFIEQKTTQQQARYQEQLAELEALVAELETSIAETQAEIAELGDPNTLSAYGRAELARLESQLSNDQTRLNVYLSSTEQFRLAMARSGNYLTVFAPANFPRTPVGPKTMQNTATAGAAGLVVGLSVVFLLEYLDDRVHNPDDVRRALGVNTLGALPATREQENHWIVAEQPLSPATEAFRSLRTSIQFASLDTPVRSLLVTSPLPTEGKSFTAANLAAVMAQGGKSVVLVDTDLRHPTVHKFVGVDKKPGLSDALLDLKEHEGVGLEADMVEDLVQRTKLEGLRVVPAGTHVRTPAELLNSQLFRGFLTLLTDCCDMVIIDSPPVMAVTDPVIVSTMVDGVAVVVDAGESRIPVVGQALQRLQEVDAKVLGVVVNRMSGRSGSYYYYYGYYKNYYPGDGEGNWLRGLFGRNGGDNAARKRRRSPREDEAERERTHA